MPFLRNPFHKNKAIPMIPGNRRQIGGSAEKLAARYLSKHEYKIIETNFHCRYGEIDIIATNKNELVFIEVRAKKSLSFGTPEESVTGIKKERLVSLADYYLQKHDDLPMQWRIDVVAIELDSENKATRINIIENAIEG